MLKDEAHKIVNSQKQLTANAAEITSAKETPIAEQMTCI